MQNKNHPVDISKLSEDLKRKDRERINNCRLRDLKPFEWNCFEGISQAVVEHCSYFSRSQCLLKLHAWTNVLESLESKTLKTLCKTALQYHLDLLSKQLSYRVTKTQMQHKVYFSLHELLRHRAKYSTCEARLPAEKG